jgi:ATP-dependent DNA ligase
VGDINIMNGKIVGWGGSIYCDSFDPIFSSDFWNIDTYKDAFPEIRYLEPMTCQEADRKNIPEDDMIAEKKWDGHRTLMFIGEEHNRFFSRRLSKKTDWYSESSDNLLHLRDFPIPSLKGTVLDAELTMPTFADVQGVTGALPETALQNQIEKGFADINVFDILYYNGVRVERYPLYIRKIFLLQAIKRIWHPSIKQATFYVTKVMQKKFIDAVVNAGYGHLLHELPMDIVPSYKQLLKDMWNVGDEGLILKKYDSIYEEQRTKTWLKLKDMKYRDVVIMDYQDPTIWYDGKSLDEKGTWGVLGRCRR